jgi:hypothetical protein
MADTGRFAALFEAVLVVAGAFDRARAGAAGGDRFAAQLCQDAGQLFSPVLRGEWPPYRRRCGARYATLG